MSDAKLDKDSRRRNNFNVVRLAAAILVFAGHMGIILGGAPPLLGGFSLHELGVSVLFLMGGFLIAGSWRSDPHPVRFAIRRFFRLWPPFAVMVVFMVFVAGPLISELGWRGYFESWYASYLRNLRLFIVYAQPGVFQGVPLANTTNGSLWTMPVEAALYALTPVILTVLGRGAHSKCPFWLAAALTGMVCGADLLLRTCLPDARVLLYGTDWIAAYHLAVWYAIGIFYTYSEIQKYLNLQIACVAMCMLYLFQFSAASVQYGLLYFILPYFVFSFALAPEAVFHRFGEKLELSYGIYLYGFFFQQLIAMLQIGQGFGLGYGSSFVLSLLPTLAAAALSYMLVEKPAVRLGRHLAGRIPGK